MIDTAIRLFTITFILLLSGLVLLFHVEKLSFKKILIIVTCAGILLTSIAISGKIILSAQNNIVSEVTQ